MKYYLKALRNFANFSGRARRKEYWYFVLFSFIFGLGIIIIPVTLEMHGDIFPVLFVILFLLYVLAVIIAGLAVAVRRLHDVGNSGCSLLLLSLIPIIGPIWLFVLLVTDSEAGENKYGENPKGIAV
ncbi:MAG: hypothetical protein CRN43_09090 [Candidatus Nephrothrix sp. EaCA]|nr:MAG: hypothetical protein CRN43_09090 [Candidatus Nephrothrix sp. EaCA]